MEDERKALYPKSYGAWAGNEAGNKPDYTRCCEEVADNSTRWIRYYQCSHKAIIGPHKAYCKVHDPEAKAAREKKSALTYLRKQREWALGGYGAALVKALEEIEAGHKDPRSRAKEALDKLRERDWWKL